jgi:hypothetical protein
VKRSCESCEQMRPRLRRRSGCSTANGRGEGVLRETGPGGYRRVNCPVFPYYVAFIMRGGKIVITAVAHALLGVAS